MTLCQGPLDHIVETARYPDSCSREDTPTDQREVVALLHHAGLSYRKPPVRGPPDEVIQSVFHRPGELFDPTC